MCLVLDMVRSDQIFIEYKITNALDWSNVSKKCKWPTFLIQRKDSLAKKRKKVIKRMGKTINIGNTCFGPNLSKQITCFGPRPSLFQALAMS